MFENGRIVVELQSRIMNTNDLINEISNHFKKQGDEFKVIEASSIPIVEVNSKKYSVKVREAFGTIMGEQQAVLTPYK